MLLACCQCSKTVKCDLQFRLHYLQEHADKQTLESSLCCPVPPKESSYECEECKRTFKLRGTYMSHRKTHLPAMSYLCEVCSFVANTPGVLNQHRRRYHTPVEELTCEDCSKVISMPCSLRQHQKMVHRQSV